MNRFVGMLMGLVAAFVATQGQEKLSVTADVVQFRGLDGGTKWEFQYAFADTALRYVVAPAGFVGELYCQLELSVDTGLVHRDAWIASVSSSSNQPPHKQFFTGLRSVNLPSGRYSVKFSARDVNDTTRTTSTAFTSVVPLRGLRPMLSDVMLVMPKAATAKFLRSGVQADPNPRHEVIGQEPLLALYAEVYNARRVSTSRTRLRRILRSCADAFEGPSNRLRHQGRTILLAESRRATGITAYAHRR